MITELSVQNFKSWQDTGELQFAPLTGFFGANNSGKTSIFQLLLLLKQTTENQLASYGPLHFGDERSLVNLGDFDAVIHRHDRNLNLNIAVSWNLPEQLRIGDKSTDSLNFSTSIVKGNDDRESTLTQGGVLNNFNYTFGEQSFKVGRTGEEQSILASYEYDGVPVMLIGCYGIRSLGESSESISHLQKAFEGLFLRVRHLGPGRVNPQRDYSRFREESDPTDIGQYGENMISALVSSRIQNRPADTQIAQWLQKLNLIHSYTLNSTPDVVQDQDYELLVKQHKDGPKVRLTDVGFGVSHVLPVLILCFCAPEGSILLLEHPEAQLHPNAQSELADVFIDVVKNRNIQIILESHSEHLLLRLMRRIAEEEISADQTAFHFCKIEDGNSQAEQLKVDEYGNISNWPPNFFGDDMGDLAEKTKAEMKRRKANK